MDSPASEVELLADQGSLRRGRKALLGRKSSELKVPRMKIKMIGRSRESDSPIFFAQSVEDVRQSEYICSLHTHTLTHSCLSVLHTYTHTHKQGEEEGSGSERSFRGRKKWKRKGV